MSKVVVLLIGIVIFVSMYHVVQFKNNQDEGNLLFNTLKSSGATAGKVNMNGWKRIRANTTDDATSTLKQLARTLNRNKSIPPIESRHFKHSIETTTNVEISPGLKAKITIIETSMSTKVKGEQYLVLALEGDSTLKVLEFMEEIYDKVLGEGGQKSIILTGFVEGYLSPPQKDTMIQRMVERAKVQKVEKLEDGPLVSVTGYTPNVHSMLTLAGKSVNINMALRYNSVQNRTMVYVGSPIITSEY